MIRRKQYSSLDPYKNYIFEGDCINIMKKIKNESIDLIVTDPPYLMNYHTNRRKNKKHDFCSPIMNDSGKDAEIMIEESIKESYRILKDDSAMYMFCNPNKVDFFKTRLEKYFKIKNMIVWVKNNHTAGDLKAGFGKRYEILFLVNKGKRCFNGKRLEDVWFFDKVVGKKQVHQNQKPKDLLRQCIEKHSDENNIVLDMYAGSGSTGVACQELNRKFILIEKEPQYIELIKTRITCEYQIGF